MTIAQDLVQELMLVSVLVAGDGAARLVAELEQAGAAAEMLSGTGTQGGFDLAILLASPAAAADAATRGLVARLSEASERLLFAPLPLGGAAAEGGAPALPELTQWFEVFAEFGYQPVVEFDAGFVSPGAFLVDRAATAAESELSAFADRLQLGTEPVARRDQAAGAPDQGAARETETLRASLAEAEAALSAARAGLAASQAEASALARQAAELASSHETLYEALRRAEGHNAGWEGLRHWVRGVAGQPSRDRAAVLARDLPRLNQLRAAQSAAPAAPARRRFWQAPFRRRGRTEWSALLADTALVRASRLFDAAWYVASNPELAEGAPLDPVFHYVLVGALLGADPSPWFDTAAYLDANPELAGTTLNPLVHAIRTGKDRDIPTG